MKQECAPTSDAGLLMFSLFRTGRLVEERVEAALATLDLSFAKLGVLSILARAAEPVALGELAERIRCVRSNVTQLVDRLEADGLVRRVDDPNDRRSVLAALTPEGVERQAAGAREMERANTAFLEPLSATDRDALQQTLFLLINS